MSALRRWIRAQRALPQHPRQGGCVARMSPWQQLPAGTIARGTGPGDPAYLVLEDEDQALPEWDTHRYGHAWFLPEEIGRFLRRVSS
jgi:hypothetical protein